MIRSLFAQKDATIYNDIMDLNTGMDEFLEIRKTFYSINEGSISETLSETASLSRALIKFDITDISSSIVSNRIVSPKFYLKLNVSSAERLKTDYVIEAYPISQSWDMGMGKKQSNPRFTDGVTWTYKSSGSAWSGSSDTITSSIQGGTWYTESAYYASQSFSYESGDIEMNVTAIVNAWLSQSIPNEGFILKYPTSYENNQTEYGKVSFFSRDTNTIYPPMLQMRWDDSTYSTGSMTAATITSMVVHASGLRERYKYTEIAQIRLTARDRYPAKQFVTSSRYLVSKYLPTSSYYSVKDAHTEETLISFDTGSTKISCDSTGNYFNFDMRGLQPERYYKFVLKVENSTNTIILDDKFYFKVER